MAENSLIAWTRNTFNPWMGCMKVSAGCANCYAETLIKGRMGKPGLWGPAATSERQVTTAAYWRRPIAWNKEAQKEGKAMRVFCASLADVFEDHPTANATRPRLFELILATPFLHWQILTKRPERIVDNLPPDWGDGYPNVWLGTSVEDMRVAHRADILRRIPASVRFISYEPALGPIHDIDLRGIDWLIYGGESGPGFREHDITWARAIRAECEQSQFLYGKIPYHEVGNPGEYRGTQFFFKQSSGARSGMGTTLDGRTWHQYPIPRWTRSLRVDVATAYTEAVLADLEAERADV